MKSLSYTEMGLGVFDKKPPCKGFPPTHSRLFKIGEYRNQKHLIKGRSITVRNVEVRSCGCQTYCCIGQMLDLLMTHPKKVVVTWHPKSRRWS